MCAYRYVHIYVNTISNEVGILGAKNNVKILKVQF